MLSFPVKRSDLKSAGREQYQGSRMLPNKAKTLARLQPLLVRLGTGRLGRGALLPSGCREARTGMGLQAGVAL